MNSINIAILGYGVVGKGVYDIIVQGHNDINVVKIFSSKNLEEINKIRTMNYQEIIEDKEIDVVIECLGGDDLAYKINCECLKAGKSVITSNKETVACHYDEYLDLAKKNNCYFLFEASVGGGIPIISTISKIKQYDVIDSFTGILNGTTNYIITKMEEGFSLDEAVKKAQELGFAEKNPSADLLGLDVVRKCAILASLCYDLKVDVNQIPHFGIENLSKEIIDDLKVQNKHIKMVAKSSYINNKFSMIIMPIIIDNSNPLSSVKDENNGLSIECKFNGLLTFSGKGAGRYPTASAIMQDLYSLKYGVCYVERIQPQQMANEIATSGKYYVIIDGRKEIWENPQIEDLNKVDFVAEII